MEKTYDPQVIETNCYATWEQAGYFKPQGSGEPYCIMLPPPNVTGSLHMGHGFQHTLMDALIRYHRLCGFRTLWQGGVDHAGIATQIVVERQLEKTQFSRQALGREAFIKKVWQWKQQSGDMINQQMRRLGSSIDWPRARFTLDDGFNEAVQTAFIQLYRQGLIYRGKRLVNWDIQLQSAVSDLEVVTQSEPGFLWHIHYPLSHDAQQYLTIATTRPETLFGDAAIAVNPKDSRYQQLIGQTVRLPLTDRHIPIVADDYVDPEFGTGCVKITPAHDFNDDLVAKRHQLPYLNILTPDGKLNDNTSLPGLTINQAREQVIAQLSTQQLLAKTEPYTLTVPRCERTGEIIQPYLTAQWYVNMQPLAQKALLALEKGEPRFIPENWHKTYRQWLEQIQDWCISRQLWWGHRIPAWYDEQKNIYVGNTEADVRVHYQLSAEIILYQDEDVLDTWFSAALWPFATLGWPQKTVDYATFFPTQVLVTGFDIIFFWVARMTMLSLHFTGQIPFHEVYITGLIRDHQGQKMSKSKGNVLDPLDVIDGITLPALLEKRTQGLMNPKMAERITEVTRQQFPQGIPALGTDALRFTFCALANTGRDIRFDLNRVSGYRNFCNKLWNATRFVMQQTEQQFIQEDSAIYTVAEQWLLSRLQQVVGDVHQHFADYRFDRLTQTLYEFIWHDYCDWYLEIAKFQLATAHAPAIRYLLLTVLETILRLTHPIMPFITEALWQRLTPLLKIEAPTIQCQSFPQVDATLINASAENDLKQLQAIVNAIRNIRSEMQVSPAKKIVVNYQGTIVPILLPWILSLAKLESLTPIVDNPPSPAATAVLENLQLFIPLADLIDIDSEITRLQKEIKYWQQELMKVETKLANPAFVAKAPAAVVAKDRVRIEECQITLSKLEQQVRGLMRE